MSALSISSISRIGRVAGGEGLPQLAALDVVADVLDPLVAELAVAQARDRVVLVEALLRLGGRLDVPLDHRGVQRLGDLVRQHGLAGAGLALDQQRTLQRDGGVDGHAQVVAGNVGVGTGKFHGAKSKFHCGFNHPRGVVSGQQGRASRSAARANDEVDQSGTWRAGVTSQGGSTRSGAAVRAHPARPPDRSACGR